MRGNNPLDPPFLRGNCSDSNRLRHLSLIFSFKNLPLTAHTRGHVLRKAIQSLPGHGKCKIDVCGRKLKAACDVDRMCEYELWSCGSFEHPGVDKTMKVAYVMEDL